MLLRKGMKSFTQSLKFLIKKLKKKNKKNDLTGKYTCFCLVGEDIMAAVFAPHKHFLGLKYIPADKNKIWFSFPLVRSQGPHKIAPMLLYAVTLSGTFN